MNEIHDDPALTAAYLKGLAAGRSEARPVPDEQAIERAAIATYEARVHTTVINGWRSEPEALRHRFRKAARSALTAALEQPE